MTAKLAMQPTRRLGSNIRLTPYEEKLFEMSKTMNYREIATALAVKPSGVAAKLAVIKDKVRAASY